MNSFANEIQYLETSSETVRDILSSFLTEIVTIERLFVMKKLLVYKGILLRHRLISNKLLFSIEIIKVTITEL